MKHDILADAFNIIKLVERRGGKECTIPYSKIIEGILRAMQKNGYIGEIKLIKKGNQEKFNVQLLGKTNDCSVIKPRISSTNDEIINFEKRFLPANNVGILLMTTPSGVVDHKSAKENKTGGIIIGYVW